MSLLERIPNWLRIKADNSNFDINIQAGGSIIAMFAILVALLLWATSVIRDDAVQLAHAQAREAALETAYKEQAQSFKLYERRMMDWEGLMLAKGIKLPSDREFGPLGNLQRAVIEGK